MKTKADAPLLPQVVSEGGGIAAPLAPIDLIRRIPLRMREWRFWHVQVLVLAATAPHYVIETLGFTNPFETLHGLSITLYILPVLYGALNFGWEGALMTAIWAGLLTTPSLWIWHRSELHWFAEIGQLAVTLPVGMLVAWRVDRETRERLRAERTSASLRLLNEVGQVLSHTLEVERQLSRVLRSLITGLGLQSAWVSLEGTPGSEGGIAVVTESAAPSGGPPAGVPEMFHRLLAAGREAAITDGRMVAVPLVGDTGMLGALGAEVPADGQLTEAQLGLLTTVAQQVRVALENAWLYRQRQESLQSYVRQVTQAQEDERLRIARELHDETAQELVHLVRRLEQLRSRATPDQLEAIEELLSMARGTMQAVRRFSRDLRPSVLDDLGLLPAIEMVIEDTGHRLPQGARLIVKGEPRRLDGPAELALFRITQEALRNVEKHAQANSATVELDFDGPEVILSVADDGRGFSPAKSISDLLRSGKLGLLGMKERAELVGGTFEMESIPGRGTRVTVRVKPGSLQDRAQTPTAGR